MEQRGDRRFEPRALSSMTPAELAGLGDAEWKTLAAGMAVARAQYDGLRRNALLSIGAQRDRGCRDLVMRLCEDPSPVVAEAARWALERLAVGREAL
jgi:epoxyqueuosine reductase